MNRKKKRGGQEEIGRKKESDENEEEQKTKQYYFNSMRLQREKKLDTAESFASNLFEILRKIKICLSLNKICSSNIQNFFIFVKTLNAPSASQEKVTFHFNQFFQKYGKLLKVKSGRKGEKMKQRLHNSFQKN